MSCGSVPPNPFFKHCLLFLRDLGIESDMQIKNLKPVLGEDSQLRAKNVQSRIRIQMISFSAQISLPFDYKIRTFFDWPRKKNCLVSTLLCDGKPLN